ncbi:MAG: hypothetical protein ACTSRW_13160 [Candidatus Helarchaeota archaeon]
MNRDFLDPLKKFGFKKLEICTDDGKITRFNLITRPRKLEHLIRGELELRSEIYLTLGSELLTYGLEKLILFVKGRTGKEEEKVKSTLKYDVLRIKPDYTQEEKDEVQELYYNKINAPVKKFVDAMGDRVKKGKEFMEDTDHFVRTEARDVAAKEIVNRLRKTTADFGFDLNRITRRTDDLLGRIVNVLGDASTQSFQADEYQAEIREKRIRSTGEIKPQLIITQSGNTLQIIGGSEVDSNFDDIDPNLLQDTLRLFLLTKTPKEKTNKK